MAEIRPLGEQVRSKTLDLLYPDPDPYVEDPAGWVKERIGGYLWSKQVEILQSIRNNRYTAVPACHGPGKTYDLSCAGAWWLDVHPSGEAFIVTTASTDAQVKAIMWRELRRRHREGKLRGRITLEAKWYQGAFGQEELVGIGRKPQDYDPEAFQGIHARYVLIIIDEATGVPKPLFDALETLMTNDHARMVAIGNPDDPSSHFATVCEPGSGWNVIRIPAFITPNFTDEWVPPKVADQLVTPLWVEERKKKWGESSPLYISKVLARFPHVSDDTLISPHLVRIAQENSIPQRGHGVYGVDVARLGGDETAIYMNKGGHVRLVKVAHKQDTAKTALVVLNLLLGHGANYVPAVVDVTGVGGGVVDALWAKQQDVIAFTSAHKAYDSDRFANRRAEGFWLLREMFEREEIDIDPNDEDLAAQLGSIKWGINRKGQIMIESKDMARRRGLPSPDRADAVMMAVAGVYSSVVGDQVVVLPTMTGDLLEAVM